MKNSKTISWKEIANAVENIAPELYKIIQELSPSKKHSLLLVDFDYGDDISDIKHNYCHLNLPLLGLQLSSVTESYMLNNSEVSSFDIFNSGELIFSQIALAFLNNRQVKQSYNYSAGVRNTFMLPKISENRSHRRIQAYYKIDVPAPDKISAHWNVFKEIANSPKNDCRWSSKVLFFSKAWFENIDDIAWSNFYTYIYKDFFLRNYNLNENLRLFWDKYITRIKPLKASPYIIATVKRIFDIVLGIKPGFVFSTDSEEYLPVKSIQEAYNNIYKIGENAPLIIYSQKKSIKKMGQNKKIFYYSLTNPDLMNMSHIIRNVSSINNELKMLIKLNKELLFFLSEQDYISEYSNFSFKYFHSEANDFGIYSSIESLSEYDTIVNKLLEQNFSQQGISKHSNFFRGSVGVLF